MANLPARLPHHRHIDHVVCLGCEKVLYRPGQIPPNAVVEMDEMEGDGSMIRVSLKVSSYHSRSECTSPELYGAKIVYLEEKT